MRGTQAWIIVSAYLLYIHWTSAQSTTMATTQYTAPPDDGTWSPCTNIQFQTCGFKYRLKKGAVKKSRGGNGWVGKRCLREMNHWVKYANKPQTDLFSECPDLEFQNCMPPPWVQEPTSKDWFLFQDMAEQKTSFFTAQQRCMEYYGNLASIRTRHEWDFISAVLKKIYTVNTEKCFMIGLVRVQGNEPQDANLEPDKKGWYWLDGTDYNRKDQFDWAPKEPNDGWETYNITFKIDFEQAACVKRINSTTVGMYDSNLFYQPNPWFWYICRKSCYTSSNGIIPLGGAWDYYEKGNEKGNEEK